MKTTLKIIVLLLLTACSRPPKCENFDGFLERFNTDFMFQKNRVKFPFIDEYYDSDSDKYMQVAVESKHWRKVDLSWSTADAERDLDAYIRGINSSNDTTIVHFKGVNNGINIQSVFICEEGCWYYVKSVNNSM